MDGSPGGFYVQKALNAPDSSKWTINLQGGGECTTASRCIPQINSTLGSSKNWAKTEYLGWYGISDKSQNPDLWGWNHVRVAYCSQDLWTGQGTEASNATFGAYFAGHLILEAALSTLEADYGLDKATEVVLSGDSAGGIGVWPNLDWVAGKYPRARVVGAPVAGFYFFADPYTGPGHTSSGLADFRAPAWPQHYHLWSSFVDEDCARALHDRPWDCVLANNTKQFVSTPAFISEAQTDKVVLTGHDWIPEDLKPAQYVKPYMEQWRDNMTQGTQERVQRGDGLFNPACFMHTSFSPSKPLLQGLNFLQVFGNWYYGRSGPSVLRDSCGIMCNPTCP